MKKAYKHILLIGLLAMAAIGMVACGDEGEETPLSSPNDGAESSLVGSDTEDSSSGDLNLEDSSSNSSFSGGASSGDLDTETVFPATGNMYLCHNQTLEERTEYILTWDKVDGAAEYEISAFGQTFTATDNSYDFTAYCSVGASEEFSVKALDDSGEYLDLEATTVVEKAETITSGLIYSRQVDGTYTVSRENAEIVNGRLVLPDTYNGKEVTKTVSSADDKSKNGIMSVRFPKSLIEIGEKTFFKSSLVNIIIPEGVKTIGDYAFASNYTLKKVVFPNTLTTIGDWAFDSCGMEELFIPKNVMILGEYAFSMGELKKVTFEEGSKVKELPRAVFSMSFLSDINIPDGVEKIGEEAFYCCNFTKITIPDSVRTIGYIAFGGNENLTSLHIPKGVTELESGALYDEERATITTFTVAEDNPAYKAVDGNIYSKDGTVLVQYAGGKADTEFTVPNGVTKIGDYAFASATNLVKVTLPEGVKEIGDWAFTTQGSKYNLAEINFPEGLTTIGASAFALTKLTKVILPDSVTIIKGDAFAYLTLKEFRMPPRIEVFGEQAGFTIAVLEIPEGMKLGCGSFIGMNIGKLVMPKTFEASEGALFGNIPLLTNYLHIPEVFYKGTEAELTKLIEDGLVAEDAFSGKEKTVDFINQGADTDTDSLVYYATIYYYSEAEPTTEGNFWHYDENGEIVVWGKETV